MISIEYFLNHVEFDASRGLHYRYRIWKGEKWLYAGSEKDLFRKFAPEITQPVENAH